MAWDEWEQLKSRAAERQSAGMRLNQLEPGGGAPAPERYGDLRVGQADLARIGRKAFGLYNDLWDKGRRAVPSSESAAGALSRGGFALGGGLRQVATRWDEQMASLREACAHISNHMTVSKKLHAGDDHYVHGLISGIDSLDAGFDERVGAPGRPNPVYGTGGGKDGR